MNDNINQSTSQSVSLHGSTSTSTSTSTSISTSTSTSSSTVTSGSQIGQIDASLEISIWMNDGIEIGSGPSPIILDSLDLLSMIGLEDAITSDMIAFRNEIILDESYEIMTTMVMSCG